MHATALGSTLNHIIKHTAHAIMPVLLLQSWCHPARHRAALRLTYQQTCHLALVAVCHNTVNALLHPQQTSHEPSSSAHNAPEQVSNIARV